MQKAVEAKEVDEPVRMKELGFGQRHVQCFLGFMVCVIFYLLRASMSTAIISMTDVGDNRTHVKIYDWDKQTQDVILSAFFWGYTIMQIPSGMLAQKYGAKTLYIVALNVNGFISILFVYIVELLDWKGAFLARVIQGLTQSCMMPAVHRILANWVPLNERARLGNIVIGGGSFGTIVSMPLMALLSSHYGWHIAFQIIGAMAIGISFIYFWFGSNSPADHTKMSAEEKNYIEMSIGDGEKKVLKTPWRAMMTSKPFWALIVTHIGLNWGFLVIMLEVPSYLKMALGVPTKESGLYSSLPFIYLWLVSFVLSYLLDKGVNNGLFGITGARKISTSISGFGCALGFLVLSFIPKTEIMLSIAILTLTVGCISGSVTGIMINPVDLSPNFSSVVMGTMNSIANAVGTQASIVAGMILTDPNDFNQWRIVLNLTGGIMASSALIFLFFGSGEKQPWNEPPELQDLESRTKDEPEETNEPLTKPV